MFKFYYIHQFLLLSLFIVSSCQLDEIEIQDWSPEFVTPLINARITIADLIPEEGSTQYDESGFISLAVKDDSVYVLTPESLITVPDQIAIQEEFSFNDLAINDFVQDTIFNLEQLLINNPDIASLFSEIIEVPFPSQQEIPSALFQQLPNLISSINFELDDFLSASFIEGQLEVTISNNLPLSVEVFNVNLSSGFGLIGGFQISNLSPNETSLSTIDLAGLMVDNNLSVDITDFEIENLGSSMVTITPETGFEISFAITNINVNTINMVLANQQIESDTTFFDFNLENGEQIHNLILSNGQINYAIESSLIAPVTAKISIPSGMINNELFEAVEVIELNNETVNGSIDISGLIVDLTTDIIQPYNRVPLIFEIIIDSDNPVSLTTLDYANINFSFSNLELEYLDGNFANYDIDLGGDTVDVDLGLFDNFDSGLILDNPTFSISFQNSFGLEANVIGELICYSTDNINQEGFDLNETIEAPDFLGGNAFESTWNLSSDLLDDMIALPPERIEYSATASIIDQGDLNYINSDSRFLLGVEINCPLSLNAANIRLQDTILFEQIDYDITQIDRLILHYNLINGFPLGTEFSLVLHDSINLVNLDTISFTGINTSDNVIEPALVDSEGELIEAVLNSGFLALSSAEISNFLNTNKIIVDISLSTSNSDNQNEYVKIYSHYACDLKLGIETKIHIE